MCGNFNVAANRLALELIEGLEAAGREVELLVKGAKGERFLRRKTCAEILDAERWPRSGVTPEDVERLHESVRSRFLSGESREVWCVYTRFHSPVQRVPAVVRLLPVEPAMLRVPEGLRALARAAEDPEPGEQGSLARTWAYEPDFEQVVPDLIDRFMRVRIEDVMFETYAAEQGARMVTMEEATERASRRLHECRVLYHRIRREAITTDLLGALTAAALSGDDARTRDEA